MVRKPAPLTLANIAAEMIVGVNAAPSVLGLEGGWAALSLLSGIPIAAGEDEAESVMADITRRLSELPIPGGTVPRETAVAIGERIAAAWGTIKSLDSTGTVTIQENALGHWYAIWCDHAGAVIAESAPVTSAEQAERLVQWMRDNAVAARVDVVEGQHAEALAIAELAPKAPPAGLEHLAPATKPTLVDMFAGAIRFGLGIKDHGERERFLEAWLQGDVAEWPEFAETIGREPANG